MAMPSLDPPNYTPLTKVVAGLLAIDGPPVDRDHAVAATILDTVVGEVADQIMVFGGEPYVPVKALSPTVLPDATDDAEEHGTLDS